MRRVLGGLIVALLVAGGFAAGRLTAPRARDRVTRELVSPSGETLPALAAPDGWSTVKKGTVDRAFLVRVYPFTASQWWIGYRCTSSIAEFSIGLGRLSGPFDPLSDYGGDDASLDSNDIGNPSSGAQYFNARSDQATSYAVHGNVRGAGLCNFVIAEQSA